MVNIQHNESNIYIYTEKKDNDRMGGGRSELNYMSDKKLFKTSANSSNNNREREEEEEEEEVYIS